MLILIAIGSSARLTAYILMAGEADDYLCGEADNDYLYYLCFDENAQQDQQDPLSFAEPLSPVHPLSFAEPLSPAKADVDAEWFGQMERPVQTEQKHPVQTKEMKQHQAVLLAPWGNIINALSLPATTCNVQPKKECKPPSMRQQEKLEKEKLEEKLEKDRQEKIRQLNAFLNKKRAARASGNLPLPKRPAPLTKSDKKGKQMDAAHPLGFKSLTQILPIVQPSDDNVLARYREIFNPAGISLPRAPAPKAAKLSPAAQHKREKCVDVQMFSS